MNTAELKSFNYLENGEVTFTILDTIKTIKSLDSGLYKIGYLGYPENRVELKMLNDKESVKIYDFEDKKKLDSIYESFFNKKIKNKVNSLGFLHKLGVLLYGKEGTGKTTIIKYYYNKAIEEENAIVFHMDSYDSDIVNCWNFIKEIRKIQNNPIIILFEECDVLIANRCESILKTMLDGVMSIENCISYATTNYIDVIPNALKERESRFKYKIEIKGIDDIKVVNTIISNMLDTLFNKKEIKEFSEENVNKTLDEIKQFCLDKIMDIESYSKPIAKRIGFFQS